MKCVILAGGLGTRLGVFTTFANKHMLPVFDKPMICYPIQTALQAGIKDIAVVVSGSFAGQVINFIKDGKHLGLDKVTYLFQDKSDGGIGDALLLAEDFAGEGNICVILGDNTTDASIKLEVDLFNELQSKVDYPLAKVFLKDVDDPKRFGVASLKKDKLIKIVEKPKRPVSNLAVTGLYLYDNNVFKFIKKCFPSLRGQLEITDCNNLYIKYGKLLWAKLNGFWQDAGEPGTLFKASEYWAKKALQQK